MFISVTKKDLSTFFFWLSTPYLKLAKISVDEILVMHNFWIIKVTKKWWRRRWCWQGHEVLFFCLKKRTNMVRTDWDSLFLNHYKKLTEAGINWINRLPLNVINLSKETVSTVITDETKGEKDSKLFLQSIFLYFWNRSSRGSTLSLLFQSVYFVFYTWK